MQLDPNALRAILSQSDEDLWSLIRKIAKSNGITVSETPPSPAEMNKLRSSLSNAPALDPEKAFSLLSQYRRNGKL